VDCRSAGRDPDPARLDRKLQLAYPQHRRVHVRDVHVRPRSGEDDADPEPLVDREGDGAAEPVAVVELPRRDPVEDGRVLDRVRVPDLVRAEEERLVVPVVPGAPDDPGERSLRADREVELDRPVERLDPGCERVVDEEAVPAEVTRRRRRLEPDRLH
jgi:hypothetical protein